MTNVVTLKLSKPASNRRKLTKLCEWIDANIDKKIGWTELVELSGFDHVELQKQFMIAYKISPMQWIRSRRVENCKVSMAETLGMRSHIPASLKVHMG